MLKIIVLGILLIIAIILSKKALTNYRIYREAKAKAERRKAFKKKMQELEIKWFSNYLVISKKCRQKINFYKVYKIVKGKNY